MQMTVTDLATKKVLDVMQKQNRDDDLLRIAVKDGGTANVQFGLQFVSADDLGEDDETFDAGAFRITYKSNDGPFLEGATVDYIDGLTESGFKIDAPGSQPERPTGALADRVNQVIEERINPSIASHGGFVVLEGLKDNTAYLRFGGGCQGCGMINVTLKQGVEVMIKEQVPEIAGVMDVTDHAGGTNPYYSPGK
jgi:Fe/S biogenesis protein NfuA